ncbi:hypothetical protein [Kiloniella antarctica]|uniref:Glycosyltransferase RgtA/B/C/D-like domain-containing protein n=1 Tax=Kiloniella antarctica TaxID=1550907 RepID=A0ABW5BDN6_9PROT
MISSITEKKSFTLPLLVCLIVISIQSFLIGYQEPVFDALAYAERALNFSFIPAVDAPETGIVFAPLYPGFLNLMMQLDSSVERALNCYVARTGGCDVSGLASVYAIQTLIIALVVYFSFLASYFITNRYGFSIAVMILILFAGRLSEYTTWLITESFAFVGFMSFAACLAYALKVKDGFVAFFLMGLTLSLSVLTRPSYLYLLYSLIFLIPIYWGIAHRNKPFDILIKLVAFLLPFLCLVIPWMLRNYYYHGVFGVSAGYGAYILSERVAYNLMSWSEYGVSFVYWLPDFGDSISKNIFDSALYSKLDFGSADGYYRYGNSTIRSAVYDSAQTDPERVRFILDQYILPDFLKHVLVTVSLSFRGMWVAKYFGLIGVVTLIPAFFQIKRMIGAAPILFLAYPFFFMVGFHAFVSVSIPRYNAPMVLIYSMAIIITVIAVGRVFQKLQWPWKN